ncbi:MAG: fatty acid desaturase [Alphaproteobacteria bacterium]|jgi:fatty acid desaturase|nr:fatty acid desaturase [Alphaproteobacteria bacterium]
MRFEWLTALLVVLCYGLWTVAGVYCYPSYPALALSVMAVMTAWHSSLSHEALHGHPTSFDSLNEAFVFLPLMLFFPYRRYKATHIAHHHDQRLTDPFDDPESYYLTEAQYQGMCKPAKILLALNNTMLGRVILGPWIAIVRFMLKDLILFWKNDDGVRLAWGLHLPAAGGVLWAIQAMGIPIWAYLVFVIWPSLALILIRSYAEHQWHDHPEGRTIIVERSPLSLLFLNNNLHFVHHAHPGAAWFELPTLYNQHRQAWQEKNHGYVFANYGQLWRRWAFAAKEKIVHPKYQAQD